MAQLQYDPGEELMQAGASVLAGQAHTMAPQVSLFTAADCCLLCPAVTACQDSSGACLHTLRMDDRERRLIPAQSTIRLCRDRLAAAQALAQGLDPFVKLSYSPGVAATEQVTAAAQSQLAELDLPSTIMLLWALASLQALPSRVWNAIIGRIVELLTPFTNLAGAP